MVEKNIDEIFAEYDTEISTPKLSMYNNVINKLDNFSFMWLILLIGILTFPLWFVVLTIVLLIYAVYNFIVFIITETNYIISDILTIYNNIKGYISTYGMVGIKHYIEDKTIKKRLF